MEKRSTDLALTFFGVLAVGGLVIAQLSESRQEPAVVPGPRCAGALVVYRCPGRDHLGGDRGSQLDRRCRGAQLAEVEPRRIRGGRTHRRRGASMSPPIRKGLLLPPAKSPVHSLCLMGLHGDTLGMPEGVHITAGRRILFFFEPTEDIAAETASSSPPDPETVQRVADGALSTADAEIGKNQDAANRAWHDREDRIAGVLSAIIIVLIVWVVIGLESLR